MTNDDKALVTQADMDAAFDTGIRLAKSDWLKLYEAFARHRKQAIEEQAAEIERLIQAGDGDVGLIHWQGEEIERLRGALGKLAPMVDWMPHPNCVEAEQIIRAALEETLHIPKTCKENGEIFI